MKSHGAATLWSLKLRVYELDYIQLMFKVAANLVTKLATSKSRSYFIFFFPFLNSESYNEKYSPNRPLYHSSNVAPVAR